MTRSLAAEETLALLRTGHPVEDATCSEELQLRRLSVDEIGTVELPVVLQRCHLEGFDALLQFSAPVVFEECTFQTANFYATSFFRGAEFRTCTFLGDVSFACGGHNEPPACFRLKGCTFRGFVNFFDNLYAGPVEITGCTFEQGTNLLGNQGQPSEVGFEVPSSPHRGKRR